MLTIYDIKYLIEFISQNYILCQYNEGSSTFTELLQKKDVYCECDDKCEINYNIQNPPAEPNKGENYD